MALTRFERLIDDILALPQQGRWVDLLSNPRVMADLAKLLGTSDFLWEDFIRTQYENLIPMLGPAVEGRSFATPPEQLERPPRRGAGPGERARGAGAGAQRLQGPRGLPDRPRQHPQRSARLSRIQRAADAACRSRDPGGLRAGVDARSRLLRRADDGRRARGALRDPRRRQARRRGAGLCVGHRVHLCLQRRGPDGGPADREQRRVLRAPRAERDLDDPRQARRHLPGRPAPAAAREQGTAGGQPGQLQPLLRPRRRGPLVRAARPRAHAHDRRRPRLRSHARAAARPHGLFAGQHPARRPAGAQGEAARREDAGRRAAPTPSSAGAPSWTWSTPCRCCR